MAKARAETTIARSAAQVWAVAADIARHPRWMTVETAELLQGDGSKVGDRGRERMRFGPLAFNTELTVTEAEPGRRVTWRADAGAPYDGYLSLELTPVDATSTRAVYGGDLRLRGVLRLLEPLMAGEAQQGVAKELKRLKELVESDRG